MICQIRPFAGQNTSKSQFEPPLPQAVDRTILFANTSSSDMQTSSFTRLRRLIKLGATKRILCSFEMIDRRFSDMQSRCHGDELSQSRMNRSEERGVGKECGSSCRTRWT